MLFIHIKAATTSSFTAGKTQHLRYKCPLLDHVVTILYSLKWQLEQSSSRGKNMHQLLSHSLQHIWSWRVYTVYTTYTVNGVEREGSNTRNTFKSKLQTVLPDTLWLRLLCVCVFAPPILADHKLMHLLLYVHSNMHCMTDRSVKRPSKKDS